ncbi:MAG: threonine aldolase family protein [Kiloniellales bacterium]
MARAPIELRSDTKTRPSPGMRKAMAEAEVGDDHVGEDPTVNRLCETVADLLGKERALFLPSGTMCNEIAYCLHCRPGDEIILDRTAHALHFETGAPAALSGAMVRTLEGERGIFTGAAVEAAVRGADQYSPRSRLVSVEQTSNLGVGSVWPLATLREVAAVARRHGLALHMDGARLLNAVAASGVPAADYAADCDSVWIDLTKGLGAPVGAVLAGSRAFIAEALRRRQMLGGAMRQAGVVAAAGLYALEHNVERLAEDHANARLFAERIAAVPGIRLDPASVETNLVFFELADGLPDAGSLVKRLLAEGVRIGAMGPRLLRAVTHLDVTRAEVEEAAGAIERMLRSV